jgi:hypothetical protein
MKKRLTKKPEKNLEKVESEPNCIGLPNLKT